MFSRGAVVTARPRRSSLTAAASAVAAALLVCNASGAGAATGPTPALYVNYAMNCTFTISDDSGKQVSSIPPGRYEVDVSTPILFSSYTQGTGSSDYTGCQGHTQFQFTGPGVNLYTTLFNGCSSDQVFPPVTFQPSSTYVAQDNNQPLASRVVLTTLATGSPAQPPSSYSTTSTGPGSASTDVVGSALAKSTVRGSLLLSLTRAGAVTLDTKGGAVASISPGRYRLTIVDRSTRQGLALKENGRPAVNVSGAMFAGTRSTVVDLTAGRWWAFALPSGKHVAFRVNSSK